MEKLICCYLYTITKYGYPPPAADTLKYIKEMYHLGFRSIELEGIREKHLLEVYGLREQIKAELESLQMQIPYFCAVLPGLSSADKAERKKNIILFENGCETAAFLGAKGILDNAPIPPYQFAAEIPVTRHYDEDIITQARFPENLSWKKFWKEIIETFQHLCDIAGEKGLTYQLHPSLGVLSASSEGFLYFYDAVNRPNLKFTIDTANQFLMKENLSLALIRLAGHVDYIHLSDNNGLRMEHLGPGEGKIRWDDFFRTLNKIKYKGYLGLDIGGEESVVEDLDDAYRSAMAWVEDKWRL
jgi:sugar phosphate isomerase/epimerase